MVLTRDVIYIVLFQAAVRPMLCEPGHIVGVGLEFSDEVEDCEVEHMLQLNS